MKDRRRAQVGRGISPLDMPVSQDSSQGLGQIPINPTYPGMTMSFDEYQALASRTSPHLPEREALAMCALGLAGESGEVVEQVKKHLFHGHELDRAAVLKELGDVLWYVSELARACGIALSEIPEANIAKLRARYPDGFSEQASQERRT